MEEKEVKEVKQLEQPKPGLQITHGNSGAEIAVATFLNYLADKNATFENAKIHLTKTNQEECRYVHKLSVEGAISGIANIVKQVDKIKISQKISTSPLLKTCEIKFSNVKKYSELTCVVVKEKDVRKPSEDGEWGVNIQSFRIIK